MCYGPWMVALDSQQSQRRWFYLFVATLSQISMAVIHLGIPALIPLIQEELGLTRTEVGLLSSILNGGVVVAAIAAGKAADHFGERLIIAYGAMASGLIVMGMNWTTSFATLSPVLLLLGLATATSTPAGSKAVAGWFDESERGTAMGLRQMGIPLGGAIAAMTLPSVALRYGWRLALAFAGLCAIGMGFAALRLYREPPYDLRSVGKPASGLKDLLQRRDIRAALFYVFILGGSQWCYLTYMELYLSETLGYSVTLAATLLALGQFCGVGGRVFWGFLSDRFFGSRRKPTLLVVGFLAVLMTLWTSLFSPETPHGLVWLVVALLGLTLLGWKLAGSRIAGLAIGLSNTGAFLGIVVLPPLFGFVVDETGSYRLAWMGLAAAVFAAVAALPWVKEERG
ncbi:MAG: MFS transporter [Deltaproteobacteria bacterium]|nr:MFS transporter [Deltaproteobacteria bacterium]